VRNYQALQFSDAGSRAEFSKPAHYHRYISATQTQLVVVVGQGIPSDRLSIGFEEKGARGPVDAVNQVLKQ